VRGHPERVFAPWGDNSLYTLAPNGSLEDGASGWSLSGARVIPQSNNLRRGSYSLSLRAAARDVSGGLRQARGPGVEVLRAQHRRERRAAQGRRDLQDAARAVHVQLDARVRGGERLVAAQPEVRARPAERPRDARAQRQPLAQLRFRFTPTGRGASFEIDDLYVDPLLTI
jgi:hypothetical protein